MALMVCRRTGPWQCQATVGKMRASVTGSCSKTGTGPLRVFYGGFIGGFRSRRTARQGGGRWDSGLPAQAGDDEGDAVMRRGCGEVEQCRQRSDVVDRGAGVVKLPGGGVLILGGFLSLVLQRRCAAGGTSPAALPLPLLLLLPFSSLGSRSLRALLLAAAREKETPALGFRVDARAVVKSEKRGRCGRG